MRTGQRGFTLPELMVVISLTGILCTMTFAFIINFWSYGYKLEADLETLTTRLNAGDYIRESIGTSTGLIIQNSIEDSNAAVPDPAFSSNTYWLPIHAIPGNTPIGASGTYRSLLYYRRPSVNVSGAYIMNGSNPYEDEYVIYLDAAKKSLMLRTLANPGAMGNKVKTSCPEGSVTPSCPADKTIATDITSVDMRYFSRTGIPIDYTSIYDADISQYIGPDFPVVEVVEIKLNLSKKANLQKTNTTQNSTIIRVALRNA